MSTEARVPPPAEIPKFSSPSSVAPILLRLLECPTTGETLSTLSEQVITSLEDLPEEDRPSSYEGLLDVARFCVEEEPGWTHSQRANLIGGHPRIGRQKGAISAVSAAEQGGSGATDEETYERLARLNFLYERRFPGLRFVTYVAGRPRKVVADELAQLLGPDIVGLLPDSKQSSSPRFDPDNVEGSWQGFPANEIKEPSSAAWQQELERGEAALWEIAGDRAGKLAAEVQEGPVVVSLSSPATSDATSVEEKAGPTATSSGAAEQTHNPPETEDKPAPTAFDVPFLSQATFRALVLASPILHTFFEHDLPSSFLLQPVEKQTSTKDAFLSALNDATGPSGGRAVTRERVKGLLGGLLGEVADAVGNRLQQQRITGPKPSFNRKEGGRGVSLEEAATGRGAGKLAPVSPAALSNRKSSVQHEQEERKRTEDAADAVRQAQEALLSQRETNQFVIDAPGDETEDGDVTGADEEEDVEDLVMGQGLTENVGEEGKLTGRDAELAKDLRSAEAQ